MRIALSVLMLGLLGTHEASADAVIFDITRDNLSPDLCSASSPCGEVKVTFDSSRELIRFEVDVTPNYIFGQGGAFGFNVLGATAGDPKITISNLSTGFVKGSSGNNMGPWGKFDFIIDTDKGYKKTMQSLTFDLSRSGLAFTGVSDIQEQTDNGAFFAIHLADSSNSSNRRTGFAGVDDTPEPPVSPVPEPSSIILLGTVLISSGALIRRKRGREN